MSSFLARACKTRKKLFSEEARLRTFPATWPFKETVSPSELARYGFFLLSEKSDRVQCIFCTLMIEDWKTGESVSEEHALYNPKCLFVSGRPAGNIPINAGDEIVFKKVLWNKRRTKRGTLTLNFGKYTVSRHPVMPMYMDFNSRLSTFAHWPPAINISPELLANAGFFYTGVSDEVKCFHCDGGMRAWSATDDPWVEHKKWHPHCKYIEQMELLSMVVVDEMTDPFLPSDPPHIRLQEEEDEGVVSTCCCCCICLKEPRDIVILPCGHICMCHKCFAGLTKAGCPYCRGPMMAVFPVFIV